jgi:hypothetical protein
LWTFRQVTTIFIGLREVGDELLEVGLPGGIGFVEAGRIPKVFGGDFVSILKGGFAHKVPNAPGKVAAKQAANGPLNR